MSMTLRGPYANPNNPAVGPITTLILPNPELDNTEGQDLSLQLRHAIDGTRSTYVKSSARRTLSFAWSNLGRGKIVEVQEFFKLYAGDHVLLEDFRGDIWDVFFAEDPLSMATEKRSANFGGPRTESGSLALEFTGVQIA